jgi:DNA-binding transcriptional MerR regulator
VNDILKASGAFTADQAAELTGLSVNQLRRWDRQGFFRPSLGYENRRSPYSLIYTFRDLVGLRAISRLISEYKVPKRYLRRVSEALNRPQDVWAETTLYVLGKQLYLTEPDSADLREPTTGQAALRHFPLRPIVGEIEDRIKRMSTRTESKIGRTSRSRHVMANSEVVEGTRIPVQTIVEFHREGLTVDQILAEYPSLRREDVQAVLAKAGERAA